MRYYLSDDGGTLTRSGNVTTDVFPLPPGYREVTAEEYHQAAGTVFLSLPEQPPAD